MTCQVVTVIQTRMGSSRLPGKVLRPLAGKPLLARLVERVRAADLVGVVVVATTADAADDAIANWCRQTDVPCFRGHPTDLLDRHYQAGKYYQADAIVKIPSDCPLIDPWVVDRVLDAYLAKPQACDYLSNLHPPSYPDGNDVEVISFGALDIAWREAVRPLEREHTTPFLWENQDRFRLENVRWETGLDYSMSHRWTVDYEEDYQFVAAVYEALYPSNQLFGLEEILALQAQRPAITALNAMYAGVNWYRHHLGELKSILPEQTRQVVLDQGSSLK